MTILENREIVAKSLAIITITNVVLNLGTISAQNFEMTSRKLKMHFKRLKERIKIR